MSIRLRIVVGLSVAAVLLSFAWMYQWAQLTSYRHQIETRYAAEIAELEAGARELPSLQAMSTDDPDAWQAVHDRREAMIGRIAKSWAGSEIAVVVWSLDGHHQPESLVWKVSGFSKFTFLSSGDSAGLHWVNYGKTSDGRPLVIFTGRIPNGQKREYEICVLMPLSTPRKAEPLSFRRGGFSRRLTLAFSRAN